MGQCIVANMFNSLFQTKVQRSILHLFPNLASLPPALWAFKFMRDLNGSLPRPVSGNGSISEWQRTKKKSVLLSSSPPIFGSYLKGQRTFEKLSVYCALTAVRKEFLPGAALFGIPEGGPGFARAHIWNRLFAALYGAGGNSIVLGLLFLSSLLKGEKGLWGRVQNSIRLHSWFWSRGCVAGASIISMRGTGAV